MTQNLTKDFINLSNRGFRPNRSPELALNHGEYCFYVRPLVIMAQEGIPVKIVEVPHAVPQPIKLVMMVSNASGVRLEGDKGCSTLCLHYVEIAPIGVCLVSRDLRG